MPETPNHPGLQLTAIETVAALAEKFWPHNERDHDAARFRRLLEAMRYHVEAQQAQDTRVGTAFMKRCEGFDPADPELIGLTIRCALADLGAEIAWAQVAIDKENAE